MDNIDEIILQSFSWILEANRINPLFNTIPFDEGGVPAFAIIPSGSYNFLSSSPNFLCNAVAAALTAASPGTLTYTCTYDTLTGKITISATGPFSLLWATGAGNKSTFISYLLGFGTYTFAQDFGPAASITSPGTGNLGGPAGLLISVERIFDKALTTTDGRAATWWVPVNSSSGTSTFMYNNTPYGGRLKSGFNSGMGTAVQLQIKIETQEKTPYFPLADVTNEWKMTWIIRNRVGKY